MPGLPIIFILDLNKSIWGLAFFLPQMFDKMDLYKMHDIKSSLGRVHLIKLKKMARAL